MSLSQQDVDALFGRAILKGSEVAQKGQRLPVEPLANLSISVFGVRDWYIHSKAKGPILITGQWWTRTPRLFDVADTLRGLLLEELKGIDSIREVRVLPDIYQGAHAYVIVATDDLDRDSVIVQKVVALRRSLAYDFELSIVPVSAEGLVPAGGNDR